MDDGDVLGLVMVVAMVVFAAFAAKLRRRQQKAASEALLQLAEEVPRQPLRDPADGPGKLEGQVVGLKLLVAPLSGDKVIAARLRVEAPGTVEWETVLDVALGHDFRLQDAQGHAEIRIEGARLDIPWHEQWGGQLLPKKPPKRLRSFLRAFGMTERYLLLARLSTSGVGEVRATSTFSETARRLR